MKAILKSMVELQKISASGQYSQIIDSLPVLTGDKGYEKVKEFFLRFENKTKEWSDRRRIDALRTKLKGKAAVVLKNTLEKYGKNAPAEKIARKVKEELKSTDAAETGSFNELLKDGKRRKYETVQSFSERIMELVGKAFHRLKGVEKENIAKKYFIENINDATMFNFLSVQDDGKGFYELVKLATRIENKAKEERREPKSFEPVGRKEERRDGFGGGRPYVPPAPKFGQTAFGDGMSAPFRGNASNPFNRFGGGYNSRWGNGPLRNDRPFSRNQQDEDFEKGGRGPAPRYPAFAANQQGGNRPPTPRQQEERKSYATKANAEPIGARSGESGASEEEELARWGSDSNPSRSSSEEPVGTFGAEKNIKPDYIAFLEELTEKTFEFPSAQPAKYRSRKAAKGKVWIAKEEYESLLDSGAEVNLCDPRTLLELHRKGEELWKWGFVPNKGGTRINTMVAGVGSAKVPIAGVIRIPVTLGSQTKDIVCLVAAVKLNHPVILGVPALEEFGFRLENKDLSIDFAIPKEMSPIPSPISSNYVECANDCVVPPRTIKKVQMFYPNFRELKECKEGVNLLFEIFDKSDGKMSSDESFDSAAKELVAGANEKELLDVSGSSEQSDFVRINDDGAVVVNKTAETAQLTSTPARKKQDEKEKGGEVGDGGKEADTAVDGNTAGNDEVIEVDNGDDVAGEQSKAKDEAKATDGPKGGEHAGKGVEGKGPDGKATDGKESETATIAVSKSGNAGMNATGGSSKSSVGSGGLLKSILKKRAEIGVDNSGGGLIGNLGGNSGKTSCRKLAFASGNIGGEDEEQRKEHLIADSSIVQLDENGEFCVFLWNKSNMPVELKEGTVMGCVEVIGEESMFEPSQEITKVSKETGVESLSKKGEGKGEEVRVESVSEMTEKEKREKVIELRKYFGTTVGELSEEDKEKMWQLWMRNIDQLAVKDSELTQTQAIKHTVNTEGAEPVKQAARPIAFACRQEVLKMVEEMLQNKVISESSSPWASPVVLIAKKDKTLRFAVDYRKVNALTKRDSFPLPNIDHLLSQIGGKTVFSSLDLMSGYWQIAMDEKDKEKTAFILPFGLYQFNVMPFGLNTAPSTFQRLVNKVFKECIKEGFCILYLDDILIASNSVEEHFVHLQKVFDCLKEYNLKGKVKKCRFVRESTPFLGFILTSDGLKKDTSKYAAIVDFPVPRTIKDLERFLGLCGWHRKFIANYARIVSPLAVVKKRGQGVKLEWGEEQQKAFERIKQIIVKEVTLKMPNFELAQKEKNFRFWVFTDASKVGLGAMIAQKCQKTGLIRPIAYASRLCVEAEKTYGPMQSELLAIKFACMKFRYLIAHLPTVVVTDHKAIPLTIKARKFTGNSKIDRWLLELDGEFELDVQYAPGKGNWVADALSRAEYGREYPQTVEVREEEAKQALKAELCPLEEEEPESDEDERKEWVRQGKIRAKPEVVRENREEWTKKTRDSELGFVVDFLEGKGWPVDKKLQCRLAGMLKDYFLVEGVLYRQCEGKDEAEMFVPKQYRDQLLREHHAGMVGMHQSAVKVAKRLRQAGYFWPNLQGDCHQFVRGCMKCACSRSPRANEHEMGIIDVTRPNELVCMDLMQLERGEKGHKFLLVMIDYFTRFIEVAPLKRKTAEKVAKKFVTHWILRHGTPEKIFSDQGTEFLNATMKEITEKLNIEQLSTGGYEKRANGCVERANRTLQAMLQKTIQPSVCWTKYLPYVTFAYNATLHESHQKCPFEVFRGHLPQFPSKVTAPSRPRPEYTVDTDQYIQFFRERYEQLLNEVGENLKSSQQGRKKQYDKRPNVTPQKYSVGDKVMVFSEVQEGVKS